METINLGFGTEMAQSLSMEGMVGVQGTWTARTAVPHQQQVPVSLCFKLDTI